MAVTQIVTSGLFTYEFLSYEQEFYKKLAEAYPRLVGFHIVNFRAFFFLNSNFSFCF